MVVHHCAMGRKKKPSEAILTDICAARAQPNVDEDSSQGKHAEKGVPLTFSRKAKVCLPLATLLHSPIRQ